MMDNLKKLFGNVPLEMPFEHVYVPIWYVFKNGHRIDLNNPSLIIEDWSGEYRRLRHIGRMEICAWEKIAKTPFGKRLSPPNILFHEK